MKLKTRMLSSPAVKSNEPDAGILAQYSRSFPSINEFLKLMAWAITIYYDREFHERDRATNDDANAFIDA